MAVSKKNKKNFDIKRAPRRKVSRKKVRKITLSELQRSKRNKNTTLLELERGKNNPIIEPREDKYWESKATFNPAAFQHDGKVHILYRAIGESDNSVLGYAKSDDGFKIKERYADPAYYHFISGDKGAGVPKISYVSGGGWGGGTEDPRLTLLGEKVYLLYTAFDGWGSVRIALSSISLSDFLAKRFNWKEPVLISPPAQIHKNWVLFPEKIKGKFAILHSVSPSIMIDYFDSLDEFDGKTFIHSIHQGSPLWGARDKFIRGVGPTPIKTPYGWLLFYHKMEKHDSHRYKLWAMITDMKDPTKIIYNSEGPVLEPDLWYENEGYKGGVVYSCGAVVKDGQIFVYYGGADKVSCVATADLDLFLSELTKSRATKLGVKKVYA